MKSQDQHGIDCQRREVNGQPTEGGTHTDRRPRVTYTGPVLIERGGGQKSKNNYDTNKTDGVT